MTRTVSLLPLLIFLLAFSSFTRQQTGYQWQAPGYSVWFPAKPAEQVQSGNAVNGALKIISLAYRPADSSGDANLLYALVESDYAESANPLVHKDATFKGIIDGAVDRFKGKLSSEIDITLKGYPGKSVRIVASNGAVAIRMHIYVVSKRMYVLQTVAYVQKDGNAPAQRFFDSFTLKSP